MNSARPLPLLVIWSIQGFHTTAASTRPAMKAAAASPADKLVILTSDGFMPFLASAVASTKCEMLYCSSATDLPFSSAKDLILGLTSSASLPAELSLTRMALSGRPLAKGPSVSDQVCELASSWPEDSALMESV